MSSTRSAKLGAVVSLLRYPVKSMQGEELNAVWVAPHGLQGDRARALIDAETGKVVSAKNPRRWPQMFDFRAAYTEPPCPDRPLPPVRITLPDPTGKKTVWHGLLVGGQRRGARIAKRRPDWPAADRNANLSRASVQKPNHG